MPELDTREPAPGCRDHHLPVTLISRADECVSAPMPLVLVHDLGNDCVTLAARRKRQRRAIDRP